jgi:DNA sulfur modification protein DndC
MSPLLEFRNELAESNDRYRRDFRRIDGRVQLFKDATIPGPYKKKWRERWLERVLEVQSQVQELGPPEVAELQLISMDELLEIRRIWLYEKHEFDDSLPEIYERITGEPFPKPDSDDQLLGVEDWQILQDLCEGDEMLFQLQADLLDVERQFRGMSRRAGVYDALMKRLKAGQFKDEEEAIQIKRSEKERLESALSSLDPIDVVEDVDDDEDEPVIHQIVV